jgi:sugar phosphate isomerase/epimerase
VHAPCLLITQRVWGPDPWAKLQKAQRCAETVGARTVVVHPPFRWQRDYARDFISGVAKMSDETDVVFAVENMFPLRARGREVVPYAPDWSPVEHDYGHVTLDLSHTAVSGSDAIEMAQVLGDRLAHVHLADGLGTAKDEHLVPGRGGQPCAELLHRLRTSYEGVVVVEINTRRADTRAQREADLVEALTFTRLHLSEQAAADAASRQRHSA